jgi:hypothetical protein
LALVGAEFAQFPPSVDSVRADRQPRSMEHCDPRFEPLLRSFDTDELENAPSSVYATWRDFSLAYLNPSWFRFAQENGGEPAISKEWGLGASVLEAIDPALRSFYEDGMLESLRSSKPWAHRYQCSSAQRYREFSMQVYPLQDRCGFLVVNALVVEKPHDAGEHIAFRPIEALYTDADGLIVQCVHCRKIRRANETRRWDWVPAWVERAPENASGGLCRPCYDFFFGAARLTPHGFREKA